MNSPRTTKIIASALFPTESMVIAPKINGRAAPTSTPERTSGFARFTLTTPADFTYAAMRPAEVKTADPMAKPLPGGGGVTHGIKGVRVVPDLLLNLFNHLGNTTGVVRNWAIGIRGKGHAK